MHGNLLYEYAVIRFVPRVEREEFLNVGVVVFCKQHKQVHVLFHLDENKLEAFAPGTDVLQMILPAPQHGSWKNS